MLSWFACSDAAADDTPTDGSTASNAVNFVIGNTKLENGECSLFVECADQATGGKHAGELLRR
jgi:hypothetical protein